MLQYLLDLGVNLHIKDKRGQTPVTFSIRHNKHQFKELLIKHGANPPETKEEILHKKNKEKDNNKKQIFKDTTPKEKINERLIPKEYVLQILDEGRYRPITEVEFDLLRQEIPDIAKLFEDENEIEKM